MAFRVRGIFSYWALPIISGIVWLTMLLVLLLYWIIHEHSVHYVSMAERQHIAYISDVGASTLKPLFIVGCCITTVFLDLSFAAERWLRHRGRLVPNGSRGEKILAGLTIVFATVGTAGLILLSIFDTVHHPKLHNVFLFLFIAGYMLSAVFICWEYQRLGVRYVEHRTLSTSFWIKLFFILTELFLAVAFATCSWKKLYNVAAILEWVVSLVFSFYVFSFIFDLWPAVHTRAPEARFAKPGHHTPREMEESADNSERNLYRRDYQMDRRPNDF